jgi:hypothetical protein
MFRELTLMFMIAACIFCGYETYVHLQKLKYGKYKIMDIILSLYFYFTGCLVFFLTLAMLRKYILMF